MKTTNKLQLALTFPTRVIKRHLPTASDRVLKAKQQMEARERHYAHHTILRDKFLSIGGVALF